MTDKEKNEKPDEELTEEEARKRLQDMIDRMTVKDIVADMMISLSSLAYKKLGLPEDSNAKFKDLDQAKQAIDCLAGLLEGIKPVFSEDELKTFETTIANLKMAFVQSR